MCFQGSEYRERLRAIDFLVCYYFLRGPQQMGRLLSHSNLVHSSLVSLFNQLLFAIPMYTLTSLGMILIHFLVEVSLVSVSIVFTLPPCLFAIPSFSGGIYPWQSSCLECSHSFTISWRYMFLPAYLT